MEEITDTNFTSSFQETLFTLYESETYTDVTIKVENGASFKAHKVVLAAASPYFSAMFSVGMKEAITSEVCLTHMDSATLKALIKYMYTSEIKISNDNVQDIVKASDLFQLETLTSRCEEFMVNGAEPGNALGLVTLGSMYRLDRLKSKAASILASKFSKVIQNESFMELSKEGVVGYIKQNWIKVPNEDIIMHAVLSWVRHDKEARMEHLEHILPYVRINYCTPTYLSQLIKDEEILAAPQHQAYLAKGMCQAMSGVSPPNSPQSQPRHMYSRTTLSLFILGGTKFDGQNPHGWQLKLESDNETSGYEWVDFSPEDKNLTANSFKYHQLRRGYRACVVEQSIVITGLDHANKSRCFVYDMAKQQACFPDGPKNGRTAHTTVGLGDYAFVVGGVSRDNEQLTEIKSVEYIDLKTHKWKDAADFQFAVRSPIVCALGICLYVMGGHQQTMQSHIHVSKGMYMYNRVVDTWYKKAVMPHGLPSGSALPYKDLIYVLGGSDQMFMCYSPPTDTWTQLTRPTLSHLGAPAVILEDRVWLMGGMRHGVGGHECHKTVECYDFEKKQWSTSEVELPVGLTNHMGLLIPVSVQSKT